MKNITILLSLFLFPLSLLAKEEAWKTERDLKEHESASKLRQDMRNFLPHIMSRRITESDEQAFYNLMCSSTKRFPLKTYDDEKTFYQLVRYVRVGDKGVSKKMEYSYKIFSCFTKDSETCVVIVPYDRKSGIIYGNLKVTWDKDGKRKIKHSLGIDGVNSSRTAEKFYYDVVSDIRWALLSALPKPKIGATEDFLRDSKKRLTLYQTVSADGSRELREYYYRGSSKKPREERTRKE